MNSKLDDTLRAVAEDVFASLTFMMPMPDDDDMQTGADAGTVRYITASVAFSGPFSGTLFVGVSSQMLSAIGSNMLGLNFDEVPSDVQRQDAFKELANVLCGNMLPVLAGVEAVFDVRPPRILPSDQSIPDTVERLPSVGRSELVLDEGRAELVLFADSDIAVGA